LSDSFNQLVYYIYCYLSHTCLIASIS